MGMDHCEEHSPFLLLHFLFSFLAHTFLRRWDPGERAQAKAVGTIATLETADLKLQTSHSASIYFSVLIIQWEDWVGAQQ